MKAPSEAGFLATVLALANLRGWRTLHLRPASGMTAWHICGNKHKPRK